MAWFKHEHIVQCGFETWVTDRNSSTDNEDQTDVQDINHPHWKTMHLKFFIPSCKDEPYVISPVFTSNQGISVFLYLSSKIYFSYSLNFLSYLTVLNVPFYIMPCVSFLNAFYVFSKALWIALLLKGAIQVNLPCRIYKASQWDSIKLHQIHTSQTWG